MNIGFNIPCIQISLKKVFGLLEFAQIPRKDGRAQPRIEEPDEENRGYDDIFPGSDNTPDSGGQTDKSNPEDPVHPDTNTEETDHEDSSKKEDIFPLEEDDDWDKDITEEEITQTDEVWESEKNKKNDEFDIPDDIDEYDPDHPLKELPDSDETNEEFEETQEKPIVETPDEEVPPIDFPDEDELDLKP